MLLLSVDQSSYLHVVHLSHHMLFLVYLVVLCLEFQALLDHLLVLHRICMWHFYLLALILLYKHLIVQYLTDCMLLTWLDYFLWHVIWLLWILEIEFWILWIAFTLVSSMYVIWALFWVHDSNLVKITDFTLSKFKYLIFTKLRFLPLSPYPLVYSSFWTSCTALLFWGDLWPCLSLCHTPAYCFEVIHLPTSTPFLPYAWHCLSGCPVPQYLQFATNFFTFTLFLWYLFWTDFCLSLLIESKSYASLILSNTAVCILCTSTLLAEMKTCSLLTSLVSFRAVIYFIIMAMMVSSFRSFMNCSFGLLSYSWYILFPCLNS